MRARPHSSFVSCVEKSAVCARCFFRTLCTRQAAECFQHHDDDDALQLGRRTPHAFDVSLSRPVLPLSLLSLDQFLFFYPLSISSPTFQNVIPRGMLVIDYEDPDVQLFDLYAKDWTEASCRC